MLSIILIIYTTETKNGQELTTV